MAEPGRPAPATLAPAPSRSVIAEARITVRTAVPIEAPVCWRMLSAVLPRATASLRIDCIAPVKVGIMVKPIPKPNTNRSTLVPTYDVSGPIWVSHNTAPMMASRPKGTILPGPVRSESTPATGMAIIAPRPCGASRSPLWSADSPRTVWKYSGSSRKDPNTEMTTSTSIVEDMANVRSLNNRRSTRGSLARSACHTNAPSSATPASSGTSTLAEPKPPAELVSARP